MKKLLLTVSALAALSLLAPSTGFAQDNNNQVGFYSDMAATSSQLDDYAGGTFNIYVMLHKPYHEANGEVINNIRGFEFKVIIPDNSYILSATLAAPGINAQPVPDYMIGFNNPVAVSQSEPTLLVTFNCMAVGGLADQFYYLAEITNVSIPGEIIILDEAYDMLPIYVATGDIANHIFAVNGLTVAVEEVSFDAVKALYR